MFDAGVRMIRIFGIRGDLFAHYQMIVDQQKETTEN
jgi:hypothetical protein